MDVVARETRFVTGRSVEHGGAGDSSVLTAWGVFQGMRAAAEHVWGTPTLAGRRVGVAGLGKVGKHLAGHLIDDGASVVATDVNPSGRWSGPATTYPQVDLVADTDGADHLRHRRVRAVRARRRARRRHRAGAARQGRRRRAPTTSSPTRASRSCSPTAASSTRPDYVVNAGGVIQVADEIEGFNFERAKLRATGIFDTTRRDPASWPTPRACRPAVAADRLAERRMAEVGRLARSDPRRRRLGDPDRALDGDRVLGGCRSTLPSSAVQRRHRHRPTPRARGAESGLAPCTVRATRDA